MLASIALVGCTSDDLIENGGLEEGKKPQAELVRGDAYVNFVINTKTDSSRGTVGDGDGSSENSTHELAGTTEENTVHKLLLVVAKVNDDSTEDNIVLYQNVNDGEANKPNGELSKVRNGYVGYFTFTESNENKLIQTPVQGNNVIKLNTPIRLDYTGKYAVLAVINPVEDLESKIAEGSDYVSAYNTILNYAGEAYNKSTVTHFQMSNKEPELITADSHNTPDNPVVANIAVERTVSKTTWRWREADATLENATLKTLENLYPVTVTGYNKTPVLEKFWYKELMNSGTANEYTAYTYSVKYNKATGTDKNTYWVLFNENGTENTDDKGQIIWTEVEAIFLDTENKETYKGVTDVQDDNKESLIGQEKTALLLSEDYSVAKKRVSEEFVRTLSFVYDTQTAIDEQFYVHLTHYALTNLTPTVYAVRHIDTGANAPRVMGLLGYTDYLYTPYYNTINTTGACTDFVQSLEDVKSEAASFANGVNGNLFDELPTSTNSQKLGEVAISHDGVTEVGGFMEYLYENSCKNGKIGDKDIANPETVTGIVLAGDIYDKDGNKVPIMYKYNEKFYRTLQALIEGCGDPETNTFTSENGKIITPNSTNDDAEEAGIDVYPQGRCFYYSAQIKHFEDSSPKEIGVMEYAIMRNNIYSLAVKSIEGIGDARITVTENDPLTDIRSYVQLEVSILPWIVRFNDLEL